MQFRGPIVSETYDTLWEIPVRSILRWDGSTLTTQYHFRSTVGHHHFLLLQFVTNHHYVTRYHCCGWYFIPKTKKKSLYCGRILKNGKAGPVRQMAAQIRVVEFDRTKQRMHQRYARTEFLNDVWSIKPV